MKILFSPPAAPSLITDGLILNLDAGDASSYSGSGTTWTDLSGEGNHLTLSGSPSYSTDNGGYLNFDGSNDYGYFSSSITNFAGNEMTFSVWNYGIQAKSSSIIYLDDSTNNRMLNVHLPWGNNTVFFDKGGSGYDRIQKYASNSEYQGWHHWAFTANASTGSMKIYLDGSLWHSGTGKTKTIANITGNTKNIAKSSSQYHRGYISNLQLYNQELSASEVSANREVHLSRFQAGSSSASLVSLTFRNGVQIGTSPLLPLITVPVAAIPTDDLEVYINPSSYSSGTTVPDSSGNSRTYNLVNGVVHNTSPNRFTLDGTNDFLAAASNYNITTGNATFIVWIKRNGDQSEWTGIFFDRISSANGIHFYDDSNKIAYTWNNVNNTYSWESNLLVDDATWTMVAVSVNSSSVKAYRYTSSSTPSTATNSNSHSQATFQNLSIGRDSSSYGGSNRHFNGDIGHALFYSSTLTDSQITDIYNATKSTYGYGSGGGRGSGLITNGLVLHLDPDDSSSYSGSGSSWNNLVSSGGTGNGTISGATYTAASGSDGGYFSFDGSNDSVSFSTHNFGDAATLFCFVRPESTGTIRTLFSNAGAGGDDDGLHFYLNQWNTSNNKMAIEYGDGSSGGSLVSSNTITNSSWQAMTFTYDRANNKTIMYNNTTQWGVDTSATINSNTNAAFKIGRFEETSNYWYKGRIGIYLMYNRELSSSEVTQLYNHYKSRYGL